MFPHPWRWLLLLLPVAACSRRPNAPDVSGIQLHLQFERFDKDFYALDSLNVGDGLPGLIAKYPTFAPVFFRDVLALGQAADSPAVVRDEVRRLLTYTNNLKDSVFQKYPDTSYLNDVLSKDLRYVKFYFPDYKIPKIITMIGNFGGREVWTDAGLAIGLEFYMGSRFSFYQDPVIQETWPDYLSRKFSSEYLPVNVDNAILADMYPNNNNDTLPLIYQMIELGKRLFVLDKLLPDAPDTVKTGYTAAQLAWCRRYPGQIWHFFIDKNLLYSYNPDEIVNYLHDGPFTQGMPPESPGNIGAFVGWQIVKKYVEKEGDMSPKEMMEVPAKTILEEAKYDPK